MRPQSGEDKILLEPNWKKFPDLYDNLLFLKNDVGFNESEIGNAYVYFLMTYKPGSKLNNPTQIQRCSLQEKIRPLKKDFQEKTRTYFSNLKRLIKYENGTKEDAVFEILPEEVVDAFKKSPVRVFITIEDVIADIFHFSAERQQADPFEKVGHGLLIGTRSYMNEKFKIVGDTNYFFKPFLEYNRILGSLQKQK